MIPHHRLFRSEALEQYARSRAKTILPRPVTPPVILCGWLVLGLLVLTTALSWQVQVPIYSSVVGVLWHEQSDVSLSASRPEALLFVPATPTPALHPGQTVALQVALTGESFTGSIVLVTPGVVTPEEARLRYALPDDLARVLTQPSVVVQVRLAPTRPTDLVGTLSLTAQVQVGTQSVLSLVPHLLSGLGRR